MNYLETSDLSMESTPHRLTADEARAQSADAEVRQITHHNRVDMDRAQKAIRQAVAQARRSADVTDVFDVGQLEESLRKLGYKTETNCCEDCNHVTIFW